MLAKVQPEHAEALLVNDAELGLREDILPGGARSSLNLDVIGSPQQREVADMAGSRWNFGGLWTQEK